MSSTIKRQSAAVMFTDIAGYTSIMANDEEKALSLLQDKRKILKPLIKQHDGIYVKGTGDGTLSYFDSAYNASKCAKLFQESIYDNKNMNVRVGIHVGDIVFDDGDVYGDGVNVASRLESMSPVGGICVSNTVYDELRNKKEFDGVELGLQSLKGVGRLIEIYGLKGDLLTEPKPSDYQDNKVVVHSDDEVPSIAIIPFRNKGKEEDAFYAYGICADLISDVSSAGLIRVASKKQIDEAGELPQDELAKKLDVRYMANGELWRMGDMFQLSVELYDTKDKKVVWSDRWQESWDNLATIKDYLSDGLLKALDTKPKVEKMADTNNAEAYEFYLKAKHKYAKRENTDDTEIARGLLNKAIEIDDNLISAKVQLGWTYSEMGEYDKAMEIYTSALKQTEELGDKKGMGYSLDNIGVVYLNKGDLDTALDYHGRSLAIFEELGHKHGMGHSLGNIGIVYVVKGDYEKALDYYGRSLKIQKEFGDKRGMGISLINIGIVYVVKGDYEKALDYYGRSLVIFEELGNKRGMGASLNSIGNVYANKGDYDKALDYYERSLAIVEEIGDKYGMGLSLNNIGLVHHDKGDYDKALEYYARSLPIREEIGDKQGMGVSLNKIGNVYDNKGDYKKAQEYLEKSLSIQKEIGLGADVLIWSTTYLYLTYKHLDKEYDVNEIHKLIKEIHFIEFELNFPIYQLLEDTSYLETAYNQIQEKADNLEPDIAAKFLSYPIPKAIVEEWEKVK